MAIKVADNFLYQGRKSLDNRIIANTTADMVAMAEAIIYDGIIVYVKDIKKFYVYDSTNTVDATLGKWRPFTVDQASIKAYAKNTAYNKDDLVYLNEKLARVVNSFTSDNTGATVNDSYGIDVASGALIEISSDSFVIYETINTVSLESKVGDTKNLTIADLNATGLTLNDLKVDQLVHDSEGTIGKITNITTTGFDVVTITISGGEGGAAIYRTSNTLSPTLLDTKILLFTDLIVPTGITINELKVNDLIFDNDGTVGKIDSVDIANNKVAVMTITKSDNTDHMPLAPSVKELRIKNGGSGYAVGDIVQSTTAGVFAEVLTISTSGTIASIGPTTATAQSTSGTGAIIDYDQVVYGGYGKNWAALTNAAVTNAQVIADTDDFDIGYDYTVTTAGTGYAVGDIVPTSISNVFVEVMSVGTSGEILTVDFTRDVTQSTSGTGASITAVPNSNIFIIPSDIWNKGVAVISLTNNDGASVEYYRTGDILVKYGIGIDSKLYKFEYDEVKGVIKQSYTKLSGTGGCEEILGCFTTAPTTFNQGDKYYNTTDNLIHIADTAATWDAGSTPSEKVIYLNKNNKQLYAYVDNVFEVYGGSGISSKAGNAIQNITGSSNPTEDGLYVEDLSAIVNSISLSQKTVNSDLDYCFVGFWNNTNSNVTVTCTRGAAIPFNTKFEGNLDFNSTNKAIKLKAGHRYKLHYQCKQKGTTANENHMERFYNETTSEWLKMACNCDTADETHTMEEIYVPTVDCEVSVRNCWCPTTSFDMRVNCINTGPSGPGLRTIDCESAFIVTEIGKTVTVDPVAYLSKDGNLEETPVGSIISYMGNNVPKHYLACDGSEYNIADYPELAKHFKDDLGAVNYFGGDGITTFAVPDKQIDASVLKLNPTMTSNTTPEGQVIYNNLYQDFRPYMAFGDSNNPSEKDCYVAHAKPSYLGYKFVNPTVITAYSLQPRGYLDNNTISGAPSDWQLQASNDMTNWITLDTQSGITWTSTSDVQVFYLNNTTAYQAYRIYATNSANTDSFIIIGNLKFGIPGIEEASYIKYETTHKVFFGDQTTYKVSVPITYNFPQTPQMVWAEFDTANAEDDISMLGSSLITSQGDAFVAPMDGYYHATFMFPEQADIPGTRVTYHATYIYKNGIVIGGSDRQDNSTNIRVPLNESFTLKLKKGDTINVGMYMSGQTTAFTRNGQATFCLVNTLNENKTAELMNKPNLWVSGQEYDFGDGVYGYRYQQASGSSNTTIPIKGGFDPNTFKFINQGGTLIRVLDNAPHCNPSYGGPFWWVQGDGTLSIYTYGGASADGGAWKNLDMWCLYTK